LNALFKTTYTPLVVILDKSRVIKYWKYFKVEGVDYETIYIEFLNSLGGLL